MTDHPQLPAGYNTTTIVGDEMNGPGINWDIWPTVFDSYEPQQPMIITTKEVDVFDGCADYVVPCENTTVVLPAETRTLVIRRAA